MKRSIWILASFFVLASSGCGDSGGEGEASSSDTTGQDDTAGDGDGDATGDGDGDATGDGDGDTTTGDGDGDTTGDGDGDTGVEPECTNADQCVLVNDCCTCDAVVAGEEPPCDLEECLVLTCESQLAGFVPGVDCRVGTCTLAPLSCNLNEVLCDAPTPPPCENGLVQSVVDSCYGPCVPANMCEELPFQCDASTCGEGFACMVSQSGATSLCVPLPPACGGEASCDCVEPWFGELCNGPCAEVSEGFLCQDGG